MDRGNIKKIFLPIMRFLAMANAFLGLLLYEEKDGHFALVTPRGEGQYFIPAFESRKEPLLLSGMFSLSSRKSKPFTGHGGELDESVVEEELPDGSTFLLAPARDGDKRRKRWTVWTPFGKFTVVSLGNMFRDFGGECAIA